MPNAPIAILASTLARLTSWSTDTTFSAYDGTGKVGDYTYTWFDMYLEGPMVALERLGVVACLPSDSQCYQLLIDAEQVESFIDARPATDVDFDQLLGSFIGFSMLRGYIPSSHTTPFVPPDEIKEATEALGNAGYLEKADDLSAWSLLARPAMQKVHLWPPAENGG